MRIKSSYPYPAFFRGVKLSLKIDPAKIASGDLTEAEKRYLEIRGKLPKSTTEVEEKEVQTLPKIEDEGGIIQTIEEDDVIELDYDEMNNDERRAELHRRGLSISGNKDVLISRLRRSDMEELEDDDQA